MSKRPLEQRFSVDLRINTPVTIPWMSKKGINFRLADDGDRIGEITITGAHIFVHRAGKKNWKSFTFKSFLDSLVPERFS